MFKKNITLLILLVLLIISGYFFYSEINKGYKLRVNKVEAKLLLSKEANSFKVYYQIFNKLSDNYITIPALRKKNKKEWELTIEATGKKNPKSKSDEVWIFSISTPDETIKWRDIRFLNKPWTFLTALNGAQGTAVYACCDNPKSIATTISGGTLILSFRNHSWDGIVHVKAQNLDTLIDLYSPVLMWKKDYYFQPLVTEEDTIVKYSFDIPVSTNKILSFEAPNNASLIIEDVFVNKVKAVSINKNQFKIIGNKLSSFTFCILMTLCFIILAGFIIFSITKQKTFLLIISISLFLSFLLSITFFPGIFSPDSASQWNQGLVNKYSTHHPPIIAMMMHLTIQLTSSPFLFTFIQSFLFWFSILYLLYQFVSTNQKMLIASLIATLNPFFWVYSVILIKDVWLVIFVLLSLAFFIKSNKKRYNLILALFFLCFSIASRHNAIVLVILIPIVIFWIYGKKIKTIFLCSVFILICFMLPKLPNTLPNVTIVNFSGIPWFPQYLNQISISSKTNLDEYNQEKIIFENTFGIGSLDKSLALFNSNPNNIFETIFFPKGLSEKPVISIEKIGGNANLLRKKAIIFAIKHPEQYIKFRMLNIKNLLFIQPSLQITDNLTDNSELESISMLPNVKYFINIIYARLKSLMMFKHLFSISFLWFIFLIAFLKREKQLILLSACGLIYFAPFLIIDSFADWRYLFLLYCIRYIILIILLVGFLKTKLAIDASDTGDFSTNG